MGEAELNHGEFRTPMFFAALGLTDATKSWRSRWRAAFSEEIGQDIVSTAIFAASDAEFAWKMKALKQILRETGGVIIPMNLPMRPGVLRVAGRLTGGRASTRWRCCGASPLCRMAPAAAIVARACA